MTTTTQVEINTNGGLDNGAVASGATAGSTGSAGHKNAGGNSHLSGGGGGGGGGVGVGSSGLQRAVDTSKRKKLKSRSATSTASSSVPHSSKNKSSSHNGSPGGGLSYSKDHLDAWLENCLRDATNAQLSSSSEFLDFTPTSNKPILMLQPQQQQPQPQQQMPNLHNFQAATAFAQQQQQLQQQQQQQQQANQQPLQQQQQQFLMRSHSQPYGMGAAGTTSPFSLGLQRHAPNYMKPMQSLSHRYPMLFPAAGNSNGHGAFGLGHGDGSQDFASLPPLVNMLGGFGGSSEHEQNSTDVLDGSGSNVNMGRGFSDPCLLNPSDNDSKLSGHNTPDPRNGSGHGNGNGNGNGNGSRQDSNELEQQNKFFAALMEQINILHETNSKICRNLHETKVDIEALKHAPNSQSQQWTGGMRHRRDSLSGLSTQSQPLVFGGGFGTHSPAPTFHSVAGAYTPGMMTDVVREVKEAARVREDALLNRVKSMVEERQWSMNEGNVRILRDIDELKSHVLQLRLERKETNKRLTHLEAENKFLRQALASCYNNRQSHHDIIYENERAQRARKPFPNGGARRAHSFNLHYGTVHQAPAQATHSLDEDDEVELEQQTEQIAAVLADNEVTAASPAGAAAAAAATLAKRHSCSSIESHSNGLATPTPTAVQTAPIFATPSPPPLLPRKKEMAQLKRELNEAAAAHLKNWLET